MINNRLKIGFGLGLMLILSVSLMAQEGNKGDKYYEDLGYGTAIPAYKSTVGEEGKLDRKTMIRLANSYRLIGDYQNAELYYAQIVESSDKPLYRLYYAQALQANGKCDAAKKYFLEYDALVSLEADEGSGAGNDRRGRILANACDREFGSDETVELINEASINTERFDMSPMYYRNGLIFVSTRGVGRATQNKDSWLNDGTMDLFFAEQVGKGAGATFNTARPLAALINSKFHEGQVTFDKSGNTMYFTRNNYKSGKRGFNKKKWTTLKIYGADWDGDSWSNVWELPFNEDEYSHCHPTLSIDGSRMYISSDRPGGYGGQDLYVSTFQGGEWSEPVNLGEAINTPGNELFPFVHEDGTLYFASNGHAGLGGLDIFSSAPMVSEEGSTTWSAPANLGKPFNSLKDDFGFITDITKRSGYLSSNRDGGLGEDDIYRFSGTLQPEAVAAKPTVASPVVTVPASSLFLTGMVINKAYNSNVPNATVYLTNKCTGETQAILSQADGSFSFGADCGCDYILKGEKVGIGTSEQRLSAVNVDCSQPLQTRLLIGGAAPVVTTAPVYTPAPTYTPPPPVVIPEYRPATTTLSTTTTYTVGDVIELENIYYDFDKADIRGDASVDLDKLAGIMLRYPSMSIELSSHTDSRAVDVYNLDLSQRRAQAAVDYLTAKGIARSRLIPIGYGESRLRNQCADGVKCNETEHQRNRRTEIKVLTMESNVDVRYIDNEPEYIDMPGDQN